MRGVVAVALASCGALLCTVARAQDVPPEASSRAAVCYRNLDYTCVVEVLSGLTARDRLQIKDKPRALDAGRILGVSLLALGETARARQVFAWMLGLDPDFVLSGSELRPDFVRVFGQERARSSAGGLAQAMARRAQGRLAGRLSGASVLARAEEVAQRPPAAGDVVVPPPEELASLVSLHAGGAWRLLAREDAEAFDDSVEVMVGAGLRHPEGWSAGFDLAWSQHNLVLPDLLVPEALELTMMHATAWAGHEWRLGPVGLRPELGLGVSTVGLRRVVEDLGVGVGLRAQARLDVWGPWVLGWSVEGRSVSVVQGQAWRTSPLWSSAMILAFRL